MTKPRQEFLGPITKLAAIDAGGSWISDGYGIVDGYGAEIHNASVVLNALMNPPTTGPHRGSFWANDTVSPTLPMFTDSNGNTIELGSGMPAISLGSINTILWTDGYTAQWTNSPILGANGTFPQILFGPGANSVFIAQIDADVEGAAPDFTISAMNNLSVSEGTSGGGLWLESGSGVTAGNIYLWAAGAGAEINMITNLLEFGENSVAPTIGQAVTLGSTQTLTIAAQSFGGSSGFGGDLHLTSGDGGDGGVSGNVLIQNAGQLNTSFTNRDGPKTRHYGRIELVDNITFDPNNISDAATLQCAGDQVIWTAENGWGSYAITPKPYNNLSSKYTRSTKYSGTFQINGSSNQETLTFNMNINGFAMPANSILIGQFMIGWMGNGSYSAGGALKFLFTITSDSSGNFNWMTTSINDSIITPPSTTSITTPGSDPAPTHGDSMWILPVGAESPLIIVTVPSGPTTTFAFVIQDTNNGAPSNFAKHFWEIEYGWGVNT